MKQHILLIEDNNDIRENIAEILELANYKVTTAENGKIGVEKALNEKPDLIICDIMMPVTITHPDITRYFMTIPEASKLVLEAGKIGRSGDILLFDMGKPVKIIDLATKMIQLAGLKPNEDIIILQTQLRPGEKMFEELFKDTEKFIKTGHPRILKAVKKLPSDSDLITLLEELEKEATVHNNIMMPVILNKILPEFSPYLYLKNPLLQKEELKNKSLKTLN